MNRRQFLAAAVVAAMGTDPGRAQLPRQQADAPLPDGVEPVPDRFDRAGWVMSEAAQRAQQAGSELGRGNDPERAADLLREALDILEAEFDTDQ